MVRRIRKVVPLSKIYGNYHPPLEFVLDISIKEAFKVIYKLSNFNFNFQKANFVRLNVYLMSVDFDIKLNSDVDCEKMVDILYDVLRNGFEKCGPIKKAKDSRPGM